MRTLRLVLVALLAAGAAACKDALNVTNPNSPDRSRALARPGDVENLIGASYQIVHNATLGAYCAINTQSMSMSLENGSNLSNNNTGPRGNIFPAGRSGIDNSRNNPVASGNFRDFQLLNRAARQAATGLAAVNAVTFTFFPPSAPQVARAKAMGHFVLGTALGNLALIYDQGSIISPNDDQSNPIPPPLVPYDSIMRYALRELDSSMHYDTLAATSWPGAGALNWFGNPGLVVSRDSMVAWALGYKARFMAGVSRTPADRAAVNWPTVISYATTFLGTFPNGVILNMLPSGGFTVGYLSQLFASNQQSWSMEWQFVMGMADTSGGYATWIGTNSAAKQPFLVVTPDKRFPQGTTRVAQQGAGCPAACTNGQGTSSAPMLPGQYIRNRAQGDWVMDPFGTSFYDHERWAPYVLNTSIGPFPVMPAAEIRLLRAEGYVRTAQFVLARTDIDVTRAANNLPTLTSMGLADNTTPVGPTATACIPKVPTIGVAGTGTVACGTMMEALKYEKRIETQFTAPYGWYLDARGWGDLAVNTATQWPTPYQEIDTRQLFAPAPPYPGPYGGGALFSAATNTYGLH